MELPSPSLPLPILITGAAVWVIVTVWAMHGQSLLFRYLYLALSGRYLINFFHQFTAVSVGGGQSINSLVTLTIIAAGLLLTARNLVRYSAFLPIYLFIGMLVLSGVYNGQIEGLINALLREALLLVVIVALIQVTDADQGEGRVPRTLMSMYWVPLGFQLVSLIFGYKKASESDGSITYMGGYIHEGVFSIMMLTGMAFAVLASGLSWRRRTVYAVVFFVSIFLANYRTVLLGTFPLLLAHVVVGSGEGYRKDIAFLVRMVATIGAIAAGVVLAVALSQRLADFGTAFSDLSSFFRPPTEYAQEDRGLFSGRLFIWSDYVFRTVSSSINHVLLGFGPDSWEATFTLYAHNVYVSYIYEVGFIGVAVFTLVTVSFFWMALTTRHPRRWAVVSCHIAYFIVSLGTMPTINIEGVVLYAVICGYTIFYRLSDARSTRFVMKANAKKYSARVGRRLAH